MTLQKAKLQAKQLSKRYIFWYVREVQPGVFEPYAHSSDDAQTVASYMQGELMQQE